MAEKRREYKAGFRTPEGNAFYYQSEFFFRFVQSYPNAIDELKNMLPLFQQIFGSPLEVKEEDNLFHTRDFSWEFLRAPEKILLNASNYHRYGLQRYRSQHQVPDYIQMPADDEYKCNEEWYKSKLEAALLWNIADLRLESGDSWLRDFLSQRKTEIEEMNRSFAERLTFLCEKNGIETTERDISICASIEVDKETDGKERFEPKKVDELLEAFWSFYGQFHAWLEKYCVQKNWLRGSFFIALRRGVAVLWPDISYVAQLPNALVDQLYGIKDGAWNGLYGNVNLPDPEKFAFDLTERKLVGGGKVTKSLTWKPRCFWIFFPPDEYLETTVGEFEAHLEGFPLFEMEGYILDAFSVFLIGAKSDLSADERRQIKVDFRKHVSDFPIFKEAVEERKQIINAFRKHIELYLEWLLPILGQHFRTNEGRPLKLQRIEWLLSWNVEKLTVPEIMTKFNSTEENSHPISGSTKNKRGRALHRSESLSVQNESTIRTAFRELKNFNLPVRSKRGEPVVW